MKNYFNIYIVFIFFITANVNAQNGNYVFTGAEAANFGTVDLATPGGQTWETNRSALPGYFSATMGATYTNASDAANVNGYVKKYGNQAFTFPVGDGADLRTLTISTPAAATDAYATAWIPGDPSGNMDPTMPNAGNHPVTSVFPFIMFVSTAGQWDWQVGANLGATGNGAGLTITVSIPDMTAFALAPNLRLVGWNGTFWVDLSGGPTASGNTENSTLSGTMIAGITAIAIGTTVWVLPLKLESFTGVNSNCNATINWKTSQETNSSKFDVEQSVDGIAFNKVLSLNAAGNSSTSKSYTCMIPQLTNIAYYRLKMIDSDGTFTYSAVINVQTKCAANEFLVVYPNPLKGISVTNLKFGSGYKSKAYIICTSAAGQILSKQAIQAAAGLNSISINFAHFAPGTYILTVVRENGKKIGGEQKIIK